MRGAWRGNQVLTYFSESSWGKAPPSPSDSLSCSLPDAPHPQSTLHLTLDPCPFSARWPDSPRCWRVVRRHNGRSASRYEAEDQKRKRKASGPAKMVTSEVFVKVPGARSPCSWSRPARARESDRPERLTCTPARHPTQGDRASYRKGNPASLHPPEPLTCSSTLRRGLIFGF